MTRQIDRLLDNAYLANQLGCREDANLPPQDVKTLFSDADLRQHFAENKTRVLCQARFRDGVYTIHWANKPVPEKGTPKKKTAKKVARKRSPKKKATTDSSST